MKPGGNFKLKGQEIVYRTLIRMKSTIRTVSSEIFAKTCHSSMNFFLLGMWIDINPPTIPIARQVIISKVKAITRPDRFYVSHILHNGYQQNA